MECSAGISDLSDDAFGYWLAGLIDGEGCFLIHKPRLVRAYSLAFTLCLRADDGDMLRAIHGRLGLGYLYYDPSPSAKGRPQIRWMLTSKAHCASLVEFLRRYPLQSKKSRDFEIWARAILAKGVTNRHDRRARDWSALAALKDELEAVRRYPECSGDIAQEDQMVAQLDLL